MQHKGDLIVENYYVQSGQVTGTTIVKSGATLVCHGQLSGGLIIESNARAIIHGQVSRNVINNGLLELYGQVSGKLIGNPPLNKISEHQIAGIDLQTPFEGKTISWSENYETK